MRTFSKSLFVFGNRLLHMRGLARWEEAYVGEMLSWRRSVVVLEKSRVRFNLGGREIRRAGLDWSVM